MRKKLRRNSLPFLLLLLIHFVLLAMVYKKEQDKKQLTIMLITQIGFAYVFEYFVLVIGKAYQYKPMLSRRPYLDNIIGSVFSQSFFVPIAALWLMKPNSGWMSKVVTACSYTVIELCFIKWRIYKTNWWSPLFTLIILPLYFRWGKYWYSLLQQRNSVVSFISLYFSIWVTGMNTLYAIAITSKYKFGIGEKHSWREHFLVAPLFSAILSLLATIQVRLLPKKVFAIMMYLEAIIIDVLFMSKGLINSKFRYPIENIFGHMAMTGFSILFHRWIYSENDSNQ